MPAAKGSACTPLGPKTILQSDFVWTPHKLIKNQRAPPLGRKQIFSNIGFIIFKKITELLNEFQDMEGRGDRDTDRRSAILSFDSIYNNSSYSRKNNSNSNSNSKSTITSKLNTHIVGGGVSVRKACDWSSNDEQLTNKNDRNRKRKSEREIMSQETKKRRPDQHYRVHIQWPLLCSIFPLHSSPGPKSPSAKEKPDQDSQPLSSTLPITQGD